VLGGGLFMRQSSARLDANIVAENQAANSGSGLYVAGSSLRSQHTTIARNTDGDGSGIYVTSHNSSYSTAVLTNTILVSQTVGIMVTVGNTATLEATLWGDGDWANAVDWAGMGTVVTGTVNVYGDPAFVSVGDYHLTEDSAARDEGVDTVVGPDVDLDLRPIGAGFDIGADEFPVVVTATQDISITLVYTDPQDNPTEVEVPAGAVTETVIIIYTPKHPQVGPALPEGMVPGAHVFDLDVYRNGVLVPHFVFEKAITLTSEYAQTAVQGMIERTLALYRQTEDGWQKIGVREGETQTLDVGNNVLTVYLLSNSRFREYGVGITNYIFLPLVIKDG